MDYEKRIDKWYVGLTAEQQTAARALAGAPLPDWIVETMLSEDVLPVGASVTRCAAHEIWLMPTAVMQHLENRDVTERLGDTRSG